MYEIAKKARAGMKSKAERLAGEKDRKTDSSDWSPAEPLNADVKTGMRPVSRRAYKSGGKVAGSAAPMRADRKPRKAGGKVEAKGEQPLVDRYVNRDLKKANEYRDGTKHVGALKHGGRAHKNDGGPTYGKDGVVPLQYRKDAGKRENQFKKFMQNEDFDASKMSIGQRIAKGAKTAGKALIEPVGTAAAKAADAMGLKKGGRAKKADGGYMSMEEMIRKNPASVKKPLGLDKIPLPPRRPANVTAAVPNPKPDESKRLTGDYISPQEVGKKDGGRTGGKWIQKAIKKPGALHKQLGVKQGEKIPAKKLEAASEKGGKLGKRARLAQTLRSMHADGGRAKKTNGGGMDIDKRLAEHKAFQERLKKEREDYHNEMERKYPGKSFWERVDAEMKEKFSPAYFAGLKAQRKKELSEDKGYQEFAARRAKKSDDDGDDADKKCYGGRAKKADGGGMDPRLGIVNPKALNFAQNLVTPGLKDGGRAEKAKGGSFWGSPEFKSAFRAARNAYLAGEGPKNFQFQGKSYSTDLMKVPTPPSRPRPVQEKIIDVQFGAPKSGMPEVNQMGDATGGGMKKGGRIKKQIGGALGSSMAPAALGAAMRPQMPQLPPQAMTNAQGRPFQGGQFMPPGLANRPPMGANPAMIGRGPAAQALANAQGVPFQPGGKFAPPPIATTMPVDGVNAPMPTAYAKGGRIARASGGSAKGKGKTNINIIIAAGKKEPPSMIPSVPQAPIGVPPIQAPQTPPAAPMGAGAPPAAPMGGGQPPMPGAFKQGGRVSKVARSFKDMTAGAGSGEGRLQKTDVAKRAPRKAGGKVYRSYKDMDAGSGSGVGRLEKTEIQSRKR